MHGCSALICSGSTEICLRLYLYRLYEVIVVQTRGNFIVNDLGGLDAVDTSTFSDPGPYNATTVPQQTYYVTAAWDDPDRVPFGYVVGNESSTEVGGVTYRNARLRPSTQYAIFVRVEIRSDTADVSKFRCSHS